MGFRIVETATPYKVARAVSKVGNTFKPKPAEIKPFVEANQGTLRACNLMSAQKFKRLDGLIKALSRDILAAAARHPSAEYVTLRKHKNRVVLQVQVDKNGVGGNTLACYLYVAGSGVVAAQDSSANADSAQPQPDVVDVQEEQQEDQEEQQDEEEEEQEEEEEDEDDEDAIDQLLGIKPNRPRPLPDHNKERILLSGQGIGGGQGMNNNGIRIGLANEELVAVKDASIEEAKLLKKVEHPNIIRMVAYDVRTRQMGMEMMASSMETIQEACNQSDPLFRMILRGSLTGMLAMHHLGVAHGDLQAENVLLNETEVKLGDLGCAKEATFEDLAEQGDEHPFFKDLKQFRRGLVGMRPAYQIGGSDASDDDSDDGSEDGDEDGSVDGDEDGAGGDEDGADAAPQEAVDPNRPTLESFVAKLDALLQSGQYDPRQVRKLLKHPWLRKDEDDRRALKDAVAPLQSRLDDKTVEAIAQLEQGPSPFDLYMEKLLDLQYDFTNGAPENALYSVGAPLYAYMIPHKAKFEEVADAGQKDKLLALYGELVNLLKYAAKDRKDLDLSKL